MLYFNSLVRKFTSSSRTLTMDRKSGLALINVKDGENPFTMYNNWRKEADEQGVSTSIVNLATATRTGGVSNRTVVIREVLLDGFVILTNPYCQKASDISENPQVAGTVLWSYHKDNQKIDKQIRIEGKAEKLSIEECKTYYDREPFHCKIRAWLCNQGEKCDWNELKGRHDDLVKEVLEGRKHLTMPEHKLVAYKIVPEKFDFYFAFDCYIADRVQFLRESGGWKFYHVEA